MNLILFAHAGEEHQTTSQSVTHVISNNPTIGVVLATALLLLAAGIVIYLTGKDSSNKSPKSKKQKVSEDDPNKS